MQDETRFGPNWRIYWGLLFVFLLVAVGVCVFLDFSWPWLLLLSLFPLATFATLLFSQNRLELYSDRIEQSFLLPQRSPTSIDIKDIEWLALDKSKSFGIGLNLIFPTHVLIKLKAGEMQKITLTQLENCSEAETYFRLLITKMVDHDTEILKLHDLHGVSQLAKDATIGLTDMVETMQQNFTRIPGRSDSLLPETITNVAQSVFQGVRSIAGFTGGSVEGLLAQLSPLLVKSPPDKLAPLSPERAAALSALNGVLGDYMAATNNGMTLPMRLRRNGRSLELTSEALKQEVTPMGDKLLILVHGLCMNDLQWHRQGHDHGAALAKDLGYTPLYLRYNSGQHISTNGKAFADLLEVLVKVWPVPVKDLVLIGHSMGGLVSRSACHYGEVAEHNWLKKTRKLVCLGSPHHGAPLERGGNWIDVILGSTPYTAPLARIGQIRSSGITDLRYGNVIDEHWHGRDRFERSKDTRLPVPLPAGIDCFTMAGTTGKKMGDVRDQLLGDGLVQVKSALGKHKEVSLSLAFPEQHQWLGYGVNHMDLLNDQQVYEQLKIWLA